MLAIGVAVLILAYVVLSVRHIDCPGLGYDEVMWFSVAIDRPDAGWIAFSLGRWPILLALPYIGAVKGYLYRPILEWFGTSMWTVRIPVILMGAGAIALAFATARRVYGATSAFLAVALLTVDPEVVQRVRHDLGPAAPDFLLRAACLLFAVRYAELGRRRDAVAFWAAAALGVWSKLTFIWYVNAYGLAFLAFFGRAWHARQRQQVGATRTWAAVVAHGTCYLALAGFFVWVMRRFDVMTLQRSLGSGQGIPLVTRLGAFSRQAAIFLEGVESLGWLYGPWNAPGGKAFLAATLALVATSAFLVIRELLVYRAADARRESARLRGLLLLAFATVAVQLAATGPADKAWHRLTLQPFVALLAAHGATALTARLAAGRQVGTAALVALLLAYRVPIFAHLDRAICAPAPGITSFARATGTPVIADLLEAVRRSNRRFVFLDWGMRNQAVLLTRQPERLYEPTSGDLVLGTASASRFADTFLHPGSRDVFVLHAPVATCDPVARASFFELSRQRQLPLRRTAEIGDTSGPLFELWEIEVGP